MSKIWTVMVPRWHPDVQRLDLYCAKHVRLELVDALGHVLIFSVIEKFRKYCNPFVTILEPTKQTSNIVIWGGGVGGPFHK